MFKDHKNLSVTSASNPGVSFKSDGLLLSQTSPLRTKGFPLADHFKILSNTKDYSGIDIPLNGFVVPGACTR